MLVRHLVHLVGLVPTQVAQAPLSAKNAQKTNFKTKLDRPAANSVLMVCLQALVNLNVSNLLLVRWKIFLYTMNRQRHAESILLEHMFENKAWFCKVCFHYFCSNFLVFSFVNFKQFLNRWFSSSPMINILCFLCERNMRCFNKLEQFVQCQAKSL